MCNSVTYRWQVPRRRRSRRPHRAGRGRGGDARPPGAGDRALARRGRRARRPRRVYTHFGGMPGLWRAVRQEGFTRLAARLAAVPHDRRPGADLAALGAAYVAERARRTPTSTGRCSTRRPSWRTPPRRTAAFGGCWSAAAREGAAAACCDDADLATWRRGSGRPGTGWRQLVVTGRAAGRGRSAGHGAGARRRRCSSPPARTGWTLPGVGASAGWSRSRHPTG